MAGAAHDDLLDCVLDSLAERPGQVLVWGVSRATLLMLAGLRRLGLSQYVTAVVDHRAEQQGRQIGPWTVRGVAENAEWDVDYLVVGLDSEKETILRRFASQTTTCPIVILYGLAHYEFHDRLFTELVSERYVSSHAGGYPSMLIHLYQSLKHICLHRIPGDVAEFGVYKAGTTTFIAACLQRLGNEAAVLGFDTFAGFPPRASLLDIHSSREDEFYDLDVVRTHCQQYGKIQLIVGDIAETYTQLQGRTLAFSFFDTDNYTATRTALPFVAEITSPGGIIAFDHYYSPDWPSTIGERMAAQEVLQESGWFNLHGTGIFLKAA
jgi:O-methyltransferase